MLRDRFLKYNTERGKYEDLTALLDEIVLEDHVDDMSFPENVHSIQNVFPQYNWEDPAKETGFDESGYLVDGYKVPYGVPKEMVVKSHRVSRRGKWYEYGQILLHFKPEMVGQKVTIIVLEAE